MNKWQSSIALGLVLAFCTHAHAKAAYKDKDRMIETADVIAVVEITQTENLKTKGTYWDYRQKATATVETVVKGKVGKVISLYGDENFICAQCHFEKGRYLVFLNYDQQRLRGNNWQLSARKIERDTVEWFKDQSAFEKKNGSLVGVLSEIRAVITKPSTKPNNPEQKRESGPKEPTP